MRRVIELFLTSKDEEVLVSALKQRFQSVHIIDSVPWESSDRPAVREVIADCGKLVSIWNSDVHPDLPSEVRSNGKIYGPQVGPVVQWTRSLENPAGVLQAGRWAASVSQADVSMGRFVKELWQMFRLHVSEEQGFWVGENALARARSGDLRLLAGYLQVLPKIGDEI